MTQLSKDWMTEGLVDYEYKKYVLLAYLKQVREHFDDARLYPFLSDLITHYHNMLSIKKHKTLMSDQFPKEVSEIDLEKLELSYKKLIEDSELMAVIEEVMEFAIPKMKDTLGIGKERYEEVESQMNIEPVGIVPLYKNEGYVFFYLDPGLETAIYQYQISNFRMANEGFKGIYLQLIDRIKKGVGETFEGIKMRLIRKYRALPNPATFLIRTGLIYPFDETVLPIAKRLMVRTVEAYD